METKPLKPRDQGIHARVPGHWDLHGLPAGSRWRSQGPCQGLNFFVPELGVSILGLYWDRESNGK